MAVSAMTNSLRTIVASLIIMSVQFVGMIALVILFRSNVEAEYRFQVNDYVVQVANMASLEMSIIPYFPNSVLVEVFNSRGARLEFLRVTPDDFVRGDTNLVSTFLGNQNSYGRLLMYAEPGMLDLFVRAICVDRLTFSRFINNLVSFNADGLRDNGSAVIFR